MSRSSQRSRNQSNEWTPWVPGIVPQLTEDQITATMTIGGLSRDDAVAIITDLAKDEIVLNNIYQVAIRKIKPVVTGWPDMVHLSIKRRDKAPLGVEHFRHLQRIKNELVGEQCEAVELYPKEDRLVDASNQYHLWVFATPDAQFPFGYGDRLVSAESVGGAVQRPFEKRRKAA